MIWAFGRALRRSKSLRAVHLSGNPGLSDEGKAKTLIDYLVTRAHAVLIDRYNVIDFNKLPSNLSVACGAKDNESCHSHEEASKETEEK